MRAAICLRRSTDKQEYSLGDQEKPILEFAQKHGYEITERFVDDAVSGKSADGREEFKRMIRLGTQKNPPFEAILVYDVSRFSRMHPDEAAHYEFVLRENGVRVIYVAESFSGDDSVETMLLKPVKRTMAHVYSLDLGQKVSRGMRTNTEKGYWNGCVAPYGYKRLLVDRDGNPVRVLDDGERKSEKSMRVKLIPGDPEKIAVVRRIFECYVNKNMGVTAICNMLNGEGISPPGQLKPVDGRRVRVRTGWAKQLIYNILRNPTYTGKIVWGGRRGRIKRDGEPFVVERTHEPLISEDLFKRAAAIRKSRNWGNGRRHGSRYFLTGLIECKRCGFGFCGHTSTNSPGYAYYYYVDKGFHTRGEHICDRFSIRRERLESFVLREMRSRVLALRGEGYLERQLRQLLKLKYSEPSVAEVRASEERAKDIEARIARILELCEMGGASAEEAHRRLEALKAERKQLEASTQNFRPKLTDSEVDEAVREMLGYLDKYEEILKDADPEELKLHVKAFVQRIEVDSSVPQAVCYFYKLPVFSSPECALSQPWRARY